MIAARKSPAVARRAFSINGIVQGVGFRPFIYRLAQQHRLTGWVLNDSFGVKIEVEGAPKALDRFAEAIRHDAPPLARVHTCVQAEIPPVGESDFVIRESLAVRETRTLVSPDVATCPDCLQELFDPNDRRHLYPFINCTNCGPRYTIIQGIPYDRAQTTMSRFKLCKDCRRDYTNPGDRRFHAEPVACWSCGPQLTLLDARGRQVRTDDPVVETARLLHAGKIVAIKGLGGFHLAVDATQEKAVARLRKRKLREQKPLAVMAPDAETVRAFCRLSTKAQSILESRERPILLLEKRPAEKPDRRLAASVAPNNPRCGVMLPYTPLHARLMAEGFRALVMTSGNLSEEPICMENDECRRRLDGIADAFLVHDREIHLRSDDSVAMELFGRTCLLRRSRGYAPLPVDLKRPGPPILAVGPELKNTVCLLQGNRAILSQHIGDLKNVESFRFFEQTIEHLQRLFEVKPEIVAHDLHPAYLSTKYARAMTGVERFAVQHHEAHIASVMAEHGLEQPVIGVAFDGTGYGHDGTIWGGEFFVGDYRAFAHVGRFKPVPMPGGDAAVAEPFRMAIAYLVEALGADWRQGTVRLRKAVPEKKATAIAEMARRRFASPMTSGVGRLFDAVASLAGVCQRATFEGQPAIELEGILEPEVRDRYHFELESEGDRLTVNPLPAIREIVDDLKAKVPAPRIAAKFHHAVWLAIIRVCIELRDRRRLNAVALSGGVFQNRYLLRQVIPDLERRGFSVYYHERVPPNDGGIALGQVAIAAYRKG